MKHNAIAIIPARGGSRRLPKKNLLLLGGTPLIAHTINCAKKSLFIKENIFVSTDDAKIAKVATKLGVGVIDRPKELASDTAQTVDVLKHAISYLDDKIEFDTVVLLQATAPFRKTATIDMGVKKLWSNWTKLQTVFSVKVSKFPPNWLLSIDKNILKFVLPNDFSKVRSQDLKKTYEIDGVFYVFKKDFLKKVQRYPFAVGKSGYVFTDKIESVDIDDAEDLKIARALM